MFLSSTPSKTNFGVYFPTDEALIRIAASAVSVVQIREDLPPIPLLCLAVSSGQHWTNLITMRVGLHGYRQRNGGGLLRSRARGVRDELESIQSQQVYPDDVSDRMAVLCQSMALYCH